MQHLNGNPAMCGKVSLNSCPPSHMHDALFQAQQHMARKAHSACQLVSQASMHYMSPGAAALILVCLLAHRVTAARPSMFDASIVVSYMLLTRLDWPRPA